MITQYVDRLKDACTREDGIAAGIGAEITDADEKVAVWKHLESSERSFIKKAIAAAGSSRESAEAQA